MEDMQDSAFSAWSGWSSLTYCTCDTVSGSWLRFCFRCWHCQNMEYCTDCYNCENCFGCVGLQKKKYCILNVQYSEDEYWEKLDEIKCAMLDRGEYGEFFSAEFSQNGLEHSMANVFLGYSEAELKAYDAPRFDPTRGGVVLVDEQGEQSGTPIESVPDCLNEIDTSKFVGKPLYDSEIKRNFSVTEKEFEYYKRESLAFPRQHFLTRLKNLIRTANSPIPEQATCHECKKEIITFKNSTHQERNVLCKPCYLNYLEKYG